MSSNKPSSYQSKELNQWEWPEVKQWLTDNNFSNVITKLEPHLITGYDLFYFTKEQMKAFEIVSFNELNRLSKIIHSKVLEYLRISFTYENVAYSYQLDLEPNVTVESIASTLALSLGVKEQQLFIATQDNKVLFPYIKLIDLILIDPERYRHLKAFNAKEAIGQVNGYAYPSSANMANTSKQVTPLPISNIPQSSMPLNSVTTPQSTMPIMPSALSMKYKSNFDDFRAERQEVENNKLKDKKADDFKDIASMTNTNDFANKPELSYKSKYDNDKPSSYTQFKANQKQQSTISTMAMDDPSQLKNNFYNKKLSPNQMTSISNTTPNLQQQDVPAMKEAKDSIDLNNTTTNYIFNSGELLTYNQVKSSIPPSNPSQYSSLPQGNNLKDDVMPYPKTTYQNYKSNPSLNYVANASSNHETPQAGKEKEKEEFRRFSSEKRNFRAYGNLSTTPQPEEEYQPKAYEKFNKTPIDDSNEKFNRFSARQPQYQTQPQQVPFQKSNDLNQLPSYGSSHQQNYTSSLKKPQVQPQGNVRNTNQFDNFNLERKQFQQPIQTTSDDNDNMDDNSNQISQDRV